VLRVLAKSVEQGRSLKVSVNGKEIIVLNGTKKVKENVKDIPPIQPEKEKTEVTEESVKLRPVNLILF
jgi:hypothetical protein